MPSQKTWRQNNEDSNQHKTRRYCAMMITGCGGSKDAAAPSALIAPSASGNNDTAAAEAMTYEVGCGGCIFEMADAEGCKAAVKVDGKAYWIDGVKISAHNIGLCSGSAEADMAGEVQDGIFVATSFALTGADDDAGADQEGDGNEGSHDEGAGGGGHDHEGHDHGHEGHGH